MINDVLDHGTESLAHRRETGSEPNRPGFVMVTRAGEVDSRPGQFEVGIDTDIGQVVHACFNPSKQ
eukprot:2379363-Rhodomonas_salina.1